VAGDSISIMGTGEVIPSAAYWVNGAPEILPTPSGTITSEALGIAVSTQ